MRRNFLVPLNVRQDVTDSTLFYILLDYDIAVTHLGQMLGYLMQIMGKIPVEGDSCEAGNLLFRVRRMEDRRIEEIELIISEPEE